MNERAVIRLILLAALLNTAGAQNQSAQEQEQEKLKCANLIYAVSKSSVCFSHHFLATVSRETNCQPEQKFTPVRLADEDMFKFPFAIMTGEGAFSLFEEERKNLKSYLERGGFLLA